MVCALAGLLTAEGCFAGEPRHRLLSGRADGPLSSVCRSNFQAGKSVPVGRIFFVFFLISLLMSRRIANSSSAKASLFGMAFLIGNGARTFASRMRSTQEVPWQRPYGGPDTSAARKLNAEGDLGIFRRLATFGLPARPFCGGMGPPWCCVFSPSERRTAGCSSVVSAENLVVKRDFSLHDPPCCYSLPM